MKQIEGTARRVLRESKPIAAFWAAIAILILGYIFWTRDQGSTASLFGVTAMFGVGLGLCIAILLKNID